MRKLILNVLFVPLFVFALVVYAQNQNKTTTPPVQKGQKVPDKKVNLGELRQNYFILSEDIKLKIKDNKIKSLELLGFSNIFKVYSENMAIEDATNIQRDYFKKTSEYLKQLSELKTKIEVYEENNKKDEPKYIESKKNYEPLLKEFVKYFNDPPKIKAKKGG